MFIKQKEFNISKKRLEILKRKETLRMNVLRKITGRKQKKNKMEVFVSLKKGEDVKIVEKEIKRAIRNLNHSLNEGISFKITIMDDNDNFLEE